MILYIDTGTSDINCAHVDRTEHTYVAIINIPIPCRGL